ncbi:hypothetical protein KSF_059740 [Reticulibacter mediterranei]|uniref:Uncharacterized protein n=1 Tax=Reticulibacter mediterranei TaxID=2778369 RepID=A0A8J3ITI7_9CHLR|nr:hypothetical protein KSF_059740 [Reticulibacter mediterranei]
MGVGVRVSVAIAVIVVLDDIAVWSVGLLAPIVGTFSICQVLLPSGMRA